MTDCTIRAFDGCTCKEGECHSKAVQLGRFEKPRPSPHNTTGWQYGIVFIFAALSISYAATIGYEQQKRMDIIAQEQVR